VINIIMWFRDMGCYNSEVLKLFETNEGRLDFLEREHVKKL
jgi:hypothetical protein